MAAFIAHGASSYITGQIRAVNGGPAAESHRRAAAAATAAGYFKEQILPG